MNEIARFNRPDELERERLRRDAAYFTAVIFGGPRAFSLKRRPGRQSMIAARGTSDG